MLRKILGSGYWFLVPAFVFFLFFILYPIIFVVSGSFFSWSTLSEMKFAGLDNYLEIMTDRVFGITMRNTVLWFFITIFVQAAIGFSIAYIIEEKLINGKLFFRTLFFIPVVTSIVVIAIIWSNLYSPYNGPIGNFLSKIGFKGPFNFLGDVHNVIFALIVVNIFEWTGWSMALYIAGLSEISVEMKEAALIDGVTGFPLIWRIYLPALSHVHKSLIMLGVIGSLQTFALIYSMTSGGPNSASEMPGTYIFRTGFTMQRMGYASAISTVILILTLIITVFQMTVLKSGNLTIGGGGEA
ncbi:MAG: sugar ABC transporter permease [Treponema sp.]|jgi:multiple sugar transport system permease protein/raffinose/stachyose/melibiose transport system permease protein|nr:sugar ABC transporter permease [Treponema sp.]